MTQSMRSVFDKEFAPYGQVVKGYELSPLLSALQMQTDKPKGVTYVPSFAPLEALPVFEELCARYYGGMPIQIGYCNGHNTMLNALEYHRDSEVNIACDDILLIVGLQKDIVEGKYDTSLLEVFLCPAGTAVEFFATTLHYAPCNGAKDQGFRVAVVLPRGTNTKKPDIQAGNFEDSMLMARNKWLLAHPDSPEAGRGAVVGLMGENLNVEKFF